MATGDANDSHVIQFEMKLKEEPDFYRAESEVKIINGFPLKLRALVWNEHQDMQVEVVCDRGLMGSDVWECEVEGEITLVNRKNRVESQSKMMCEYLSHEKWYSYVMGVPTLRDLAVDKDHAVDRKILLEARIEVKGSADRFRKKCQTDFLTPSKYSDLVLIVEGKKFHVGKQIMAHASPLLGCRFLFNKENEITLDNVKAEAFLTALKLIYDTGKVNDSNYLSLLNIAMSLEIPKVMIMVENHLLGHHLPVHHKNLLLSDRFILPDLKKQTLSKLADSPHALTEVMNSMSYPHYSNDMKEILAVLKNNPGKDRVFFYDTTLKDRFDNMPPMEFDEPIIITDLTLIVDGKKFYANRQILAHASSYFDKLLYDEKKDSNEIEVAAENVSSEEFLVALEFIYNVFRKVDDDVVETLLKMGKRFEITGLIDIAELYLLSSNSLVEKMHWVLLLADQYDLEVLKRKCLKKITAKDIDDLKKSDSFKLYSNELKEELLENVEKRSEEEQKSDRLKKKFFSNFFS